MGLFQRIFQKVVGSVIGPRVAAAMTMQKSAPTTTGRSGDPKVGKKKKTVDDYLNDLDRARESPEERAKREKEARDPSYRFIYLGIPIVNGTDFESSNVRWIQYDLQNASLYVTYIKNGCTYRYWPVSVALAKEFFYAPSKGVEVWDELRIRGTNLGHRKNYILVGASPVGTTPQWTQSVDRILAHDNQVAAESDMPFTPAILQIGATGAQPYKAIGKFLKQTPSGPVILDKETP